MIEEFLLILMPGVVSMFVWRKMHRDVVFSGLDYLEGIVVFDFGIYLLNVFLVWSRNWETFDVAAFGCSGAFKYTVSSMVFSVGLPVLFDRLRRMMGKK